MAIIAVGGDVSKGYADICFRNEAGSDLWPTGCYDDTPEGHERIRKAFAQLREHHPDAKFIIGVEATGGMERNWLRLFRGLGDDCRVHKLNPLAVKRFLERDLHRNITDEISAQGIAAYLLSGLRPADVPYEPELEGERNLLRHVLNTVERGTQLKNELQSLLPSVHPYLVAHCRQGLPQWALRLMVQYPTAAQLAGASEEDLASIAYMKKAMARKLIAAAKESVAALGDATTAIVVRDLAREILDQVKKIDEQKKHLRKQLKDDAELKLIHSVHGIGWWTAIVLRLEVGPFHRFHSDRAVVAFAGLDARNKESGDGVQRRGISRRGKSQIRASLYMPIVAMIRCNKVIKAFYKRLKGNKKSHLQAATACMAKVLRIIYACVVTRRPFDEEYHLQAEQRHEAARKAAQAASAAVPKPDEGSQSLDAPVSRREAKRRKQAQTIVCGVRP